MEAALGRIICKCLYWNLRKKWWNDESTRPSTLLKLESITDIFIDQVCKFQSSDFKEYPWKAATVLQKNMYFRNMLWNMLMILQKRLPLKLAHRNTESITFVSSFLNIIQLGVFNFLFTTSGLCTGWLMKEATNWLKWTSKKTLLPSA